MKVADANIDARLKLITSVAGLIVVLVSLVGFQIWVIEIALPLNGNLLNLITELLPQLNLFALICLMLSGIFLLILQNDKVEKENKKVFQRAAKIVAILVIFFALTLFVETLLALRVDAKEFSIGNFAKSGEVHLANMPINLTLSFLLLGIGFLTIDVETAEGQRPAQYLGFVVFVLCFFSLLGVLYEFIFINRSYAYSFSASLTAVLLIALAVGVFCARPDKGILAILRSESSGGVLARHLFPSAIIIPALLGGLIFLGLQAGYYNAILGLALLSVTQIIIFQMIFWRNSLLIHNLDSERAEAKEELRKAYEKLTERLKKQTAEIEVKTQKLTQEVTARQKAQEDLYVQAETANRIKDEFLAVISHELRSPLNSILGWATMLKSGKLDRETTTKAIEIIERSARSQNLLINDLLDVSMMISGKIRLQMCSINPEIIVSNAIESLRPSAEQKGVILKQALFQKINHVSGDAERLQQVVRNLISNAIKFTPPGGQIEVKLRNREKIVVISVADTGIGIAPSFLPYVFDRFRQADSSHTRKQGGLGLGLAIARYLVELHGGIVGVESPGEGKGATFFVELPRHSNNGQKIYN